MPSTWIEYAASKPSTHNMQPVPARKPRPTHCFGMSPEARIRYYLNRDAERAGRWLFQRERRVKGYVLDMMRDHPIPGLQRDLNKEVRKYANSYYCLVSRSYSETMPNNCQNIPYNGLAYYRIEVFTCLGLPSPDPCIARAHSLTVRGLRRRVNEILESLAPVDLWGLAPVLPEDRDAVQWLLDCEATPPALRTKLLQEIIGRLNRFDAQQIADALAPHIEASAPGKPGYAAQHGLIAPALA